MCNGSTLVPMNLHGRWLIRYRLCILHYLMVQSNEFLVYVYVCEFCCKYRNELCYKASIRRMIVMFIMLVMVWSKYCKYCIEMCYKAPCEVCFFSSFASHRCRRTPKTMFTQGGGVCNNPWLIIYVNKIIARSQNTYSRLNVGKNIVMGIIDD